MSEVSEGMDAALPLIIRSQRGVNREQALALVPEVREVAARYPADAGVLAALAEAEHDAGNDEAAIAAADRAIAIDPHAKNALVQKGLALFRQAERATDKTAAFDRAMAPFAALNHLEPHHPLPLIYFYRSFVERGADPPDHARHALERALELAPFDQSLALNVAMMEAGEGRIAQARYNLAPLAADPHGGAIVERAHHMLDALTRAKEGTPWRPGPALDVMDALGEQDSPGDGG